MLFFFRGLEVRAACDYFRIGSSLPVRSNKNIFVETWKVSCKKRLYFQTTISNTEIIDPEGTLVYLIQSLYYGQALRAHVVADQWAVNKYSRQEVEQLMDEAGYVTQPDEFIED